MVVPEGGVVRWRSWRNGGLKEEGRVMGLRVQCLQGTVKLCICHDFRSCVEAMADTEKRAICLSGGCITMVDG